MNCEVSKPVITATNHELPFYKLSPRDFERLCLWLIKREGFNGVEHPGAAGKDHGCDIVAYQDDKKWCFQCKRVRGFYPRDAQKELKKVISLAGGSLPEVLVFIVTSDVTYENREKTLEKCHSEGFKCYFWAGTELDEKVKQYSEILEEFFHIQNSALHNGGFLAGERLFKLREELSLTQSQFMEYLGLASEIEYRTLEENSVESPLSLLEDVHKLTGASLKWLKHGLGIKYEVEDLYWLDVSEAIQQLKLLSPEAIFVTRERGSLMVGLCVYTGSFHYHIFDLNLGLDFWNWVDQLWVIPTFYIFLYQLFKEFGYQASGTEIKKGMHYKLYKGEVHPYSVLPHRISINSWLEDLLDIWGIQLHAKNYKDFYGKRFTLIQENFRKYGDRIVQDLEKLDKSAKENNTQ